MKILITGANGYIGQRLLALVCSQGHEVTAWVRSKQRLDLEHIRTDRLRVLEGDLAHLSEAAFPADVDVAYYLVHSLRETELTENEARCAANFAAALKRTEARHVIYLSGLMSGRTPSAHLRSRHRVEEILARASIPLTVLRAGPIIGSGSATFEMLRDLVERLPVILLPRSAHHFCQPIAISDVLRLLLKALNRVPQSSEVIDIGGPDVMTYRELLTRFARFRGLKRLILAVWGFPLWLAGIGLYALTTVDIRLALALVRSMESETLADLTNMRSLDGQMRCLPFEEGLRRAFACVAQNAVFSHWHDALTWSSLSPDLERYIQVPRRGCVFKRVALPHRISKEAILQRIWSVGGKRGWYAADWAWRLRGALDRLVGGVGLRRGRSHPHDLHAGDTLDFWRVLVADRAKGRLLLFAEMKVPGQAWLEFRLKPHPHNAQKPGGILQLTATFRPRGILGRLYWYALWPIHSYIFNKMAKAFAANRELPLQQSGQDL